MDVQDILKMQLTPVAGTVKKGIDMSKIANAKPCDRCGLHGCDCEARDYMANKSLHEVLGRLIDKVDALERRLDDEDSYKMEQSEYND